MYTNSDSDSSFDIWKDSNGRWHHIISDSNSK